MRNYAIPERDEIELYLTALHGILTEDGIESQLYLQGKLSTIFLEYNCEKFNISVDLGRAAVMVEAGAIKDRFNKNGREKTFLFADPDVSIHIAAYVKAYRPPDHDDVFIPSVSARLDQAWSRKPRPSR